MAEDNKDLLEFKSICKALNWRFTRQRYAIYKLMSDNELHPTADEIRAELLADYPNISRDSVYRILGDLAEGKIIAKMNFTDPVRFDGRVNRHDHFFCKECARIMDFDATIDLAQLPHEAGEVHSIEFRLTGICKECLNKKKDN